LHSVPPTVKLDAKMARDSKTTLKGRDASTGQFIPVSEARQRPTTTVVERVPKPGYGNGKETASRSVVPDRRPPPPRK
jgi:hypothetical protein